MSEQNLSFHSSQIGYNEPLLGYSQERPKTNNSFKEEIPELQQIPMNHIQNSQDDYQVRSFVKSPEYKDNQVQDTTSESGFVEKIAIKTQFQKQLEGFTYQLRSETTEQQNERKTDQSPFEESLDTYDDYIVKNDIYQNKIHEFLQMQKNAPRDALGCNQIQTMKEYIEQTSKQVRNPKNSFFDLSRKYYNSKYTDKDNKKTITVTSYLITEDRQNYVLDLSMDIIITNQGCMPIVKTFERNAYNFNRFVKALKFYDYRGKCTLKNQIIVDEGVFDTLDERFKNNDTTMFKTYDESMFDSYKKSMYKTYDTSILMFGNSIIFYKREDYMHKLYQYDVVKDELLIIEGFTITEPTIKDIRIRYHIMFSNKFGEKKLNSQEQFKKKKNNLNEFLQDQFVFCQEFIVTDKLEYQSRQLLMFRLTNPQNPTYPCLKQILKYNDNEQFVSENVFFENGMRMKKSDDKIKPFAEAIQYICHIQDPATKIITFIAIDPFSSHQFNYYPIYVNDGPIDDVKYDYYHYYNLTNYTGNNEVQMNQIEALVNKADDQKHRHKYFSPFYKHQNGQFLVQKDKVVNEKNEKIDQYYYITNDNQFMLIYPNYENHERKHQVIFQIAKKHSYIQNPDIDYSYNDDFQQRQKHYKDVEYKKISHVCSEDHRSKNHMKKSSHLKMILAYFRDFKEHDKLILSTDQERSNIYVYQSERVTGNNKIEIYNYENNIAYSKNIRTLPLMVQELNLEEKNIFQISQKYAQYDYSTYYINSQFKNVISSQNIIKSQIKCHNEPTNYLSFRLENQQKDELIIIEGKNGTYQSIRVKQQDSIFDNITLQLYCKSKQYFLFVFLIQNIDNESEQNHTYFFVRKSQTEITDLANDNIQSILDLNQEVIIVKENDLIGLEKSILNKYLKKLKLKELIELQKDSQSDKIHLSFDPIIDNKYTMEFFPFIYQEQSSILTHYLLIFDINTMEINSRISINSNLNIRSIIRKSESGFVGYTLTRTSDIFEQKLTFCQSFCKKSSTGNNSYLVKYQIGTQYQIKNNDQKNLDYPQLNPGNCTFEINEFLINFNGDQNTKILLIGRKQFLLSDEAQIQRYKTFDKVLILPYFDKQGHIKGSQLILKEDNQVIHILDQDLNNIYHQNSEMLQFGYQKFLTNEDNHQEYILVVSSQFKQQIYLNGNFDHNEANYILSKIQKKLLSMQLAKFEYFVLNDDFDTLMRDEFYQAQEVLEGKTFCDLCLSFPKEILQGLRQSPEEYQKLDGSLIDEICQNDQENITFFKNIGLCEDNMIVQLDFNFVSTLRLAMELHQNMSVKMLLKKIFEINSKEYKEIFMLELPIFLNQRLIQRIYPFFERDHSESVQLQSELDNMYKSQHHHTEFCNFEDFLILPNLPTFSDKRVQYHIKTRFVDFHNSTQEIIDNITQKDSLIKRGIHSITNQSLQISGKDKYEIEHSIIDFQKIVIGEKVRAFQESKFKIAEFNDESLANLVNVEPEEHIEFFNLETVRKIIDFQFVKTRQFLEGMLKFYLIGFLIPFVLSISSSLLFVKNVAFIICFFTQFFFFIFEIKQVRRQGLNYLIDPWNWVECSQFILFIALFLSKMSSQFQTDSFIEMLQTTALLILSFYKIFYYIRIYDKFCIMLTLQMKIAADLFPFLSVVLFVMISFAKIYQILHAGINDPTDQYSSIESEFVKSMLQTYKGMGGEKVAPKVDDIMTERLYDNDFALAIIFGMIVFVWVCQQGFFGIVFTFFISLVSQSNEKHLQRMQLYHYKIKARLNVENYQILDLFMKQRNFKAIFFSIDKHIAENHGDEWQGSSHAFKLIMQKQADAAEDEKKVNDERLLALSEIENKKIQTASEMRQEAARILADLQKRN